MFAPEKSIFSLPIEGKPFLSLEEWNCVVPVTPQMKEILSRLLKPEGVSSRQRILMMDYTSSIEELFQLADTEADIRELIEDGKASVEKLLEISVPDNQKWKHDFLRENLPSTRELEGSSSPTTVTRTWKVLIP